jgi:hypothetical protein
MYPEQNVKRKIKVVSEVVFGQEVRAEKISNSIMQEISCLDFSPFSLSSKINLIVGN